jgi:predicted RNA-binding protein with PUA-like domain
MGSGTAPPQIQFEVEWVVPFNFPRRHSFQLCARPSGCCKGSDGCGLRLIHTALKAASVAPERIDSRALPMLTRMALGGPRQVRRSLAVFSSGCDRLKLNEGDMAKNCWLVKQEPDSYSWETFLKDGKTAWTGVRNFQARNSLRAMKAGDHVLFYHSGKAKEIVGLARVDRGPYPDPTAAEGDWSAVDLVAVKPLRTAVPLPSIKKDALLNEMPLVRQSRLSVTPVSPEQFQRVLALAKTKV